MLQGGFKQTLKVALSYLKNVFEEGSNLNEKERSTLYYISGYVAHKKNMALPVCIANLPSSQFTKLVSMGRLAHPTYRSICTRCLKLDRSVVQVYKEMYTATGYHITKHR